MKQKNDSIFDSFWFSAVMSLVSVATLVYKTITTYAEGREIPGMVIWIVIVFHFVRASYKASVASRGRLAGPSP